MHRNPAARGSTDTTAFTVQGRKIMLSVNGGTPSVFFIKGVNYSPTQICSKYLEPLDDTNSAIWQQDLPQLRALGANAIKVYHVGMTRLGPANWQVKPMNKWLTAAYNGGKNPIYTVVLIPFDAGVISASPNKYAIQSLEHQYYTLAKTLGPNPDILGISIGQEWNQQPTVTQPAMWKKAANPIINAAYQGLVAAGAQKLLTTTFVNDLGAGKTSAMAEGEANGFPIGNFVWGYDSYLGYKPVFSGLWTDVQQYTKRPFQSSEWGEPTGYHPHPNSDPEQIEEWPAATISNLTYYIDASAKSLYNHATANSSAKAPVVSSGGFAFEWSDEWVKANSPCQHIAGSNPSTPPAENTGFPGGFDDEAWFGLNAIATPGPTASPGVPDTMIQRPNYTVLQKDWATQPSFRR
jgi:Glucanosyltransferase